MATLIVVGLICGVAGLVIGQTKGRGLEGFLLGALLGIIGLIVIAAIGPADGFVPANTQAQAPPPGVYAAPALAPGQSLTEALAELQALRSDGIIAEDEFTAAKRRLLGL